MASGRPAGSSPGVKCLLWNGRRCRPPNGNAAFIYQPSSVCKDFFSNIFTLKNSEYRFLPLVQYTLRTPNRNSPHTPPITSAGARHVFRSWPSLPRTKHCPQHAPVLFPLLLSGNLPTCFATHPDEPENEKKSGFSPEGSPRFRPSRFRDFSRSPTLRARFPRLPRLLPPSSPPAAHRLRPGPQVRFRQL